MALDPTISLKAGGDGVTPFDPLGAMNKVYTLKKLMTDVQYQPQVIEQDLASKKASQRATEVATSGAMTANEQSARELAAKKRLAQLAAQYTSVDKKTGKISLDHLQIGNAAAQEGMDPGVVFTYLDNAAKNAQSNIKTASDENVFAQGILTAANNVIRVQTDPGQAAGMAKNTLDILTKAVGPEKAKTYAGQFWQVPEQPPVGPNGKPDMTAAGVHFITQAKRNQEATISPQQAITNTLNQEQLAVSREQTAQAGASGQVSAADRTDNTSPKAKALQDILIASGVPEAQARSLTVAAMNNTPAYKTVIDSNIQPASSRADAEEKATGFETGADFYRQVKASAEKLGGRYSDLKISQILANKFNKAWLNDPDFNNYINKVREAQERGLKLDENAGPGTIKQWADTQVKLQKEQAATQRTKSSKTFFNKGDETPINQIKIMKGETWLKVKNGPDNIQENWKRIK